MEQLEISFVVPEVDETIFSDLSVSNKGIHCRGALIAPWRPKVPVSARLAVQTACMCEAKHPEVVSEFQRHRFASSDG